MIDHKIHTLSSLDKQVTLWKNQGAEIVFTNGCFDLIHKGHVAYLMEAAALGDRLVVALNSDSSVQQLKGKHRPIKDEENRLMIMAAFSFVDAVVLFDKDTPYDTIATLKPDVLVKGGDWKIEEIVGSDIVIAQGGLVKSLSFHKGYSTTKLEDKIIRASKK